MNEKIQTILEDLYKIDSSFRTKEPELKKMIEELLLSRPDTKFDQAFADTLRAKLLTEAPVVSPYTESAMSSLSLRSLFSILDFKRVGFGTAGLVVAVLVILPFVSGRDVRDSGFTLEQIVTEKGSGTFGPLSYSGDGGRGAVAQDMAGTEMMEAPVESGAANFGVSTMSAKSAAAPDSSGSSRIMIAPYPHEIIQYVYDGEPFTLTEKEGRVYMRTKGADAGKQIASLLAGADFGLLDLNGFDNLKARQIELYEDKEFGYAVSANFEEGAMYIMPNWQRWNPVAYDTAVMSTKEAAVSEPGVGTSGSAVPDDASLITTASAFLKKYGISTDIYGTPMVDKRQFAMVHQADPSMSSLVPAWSPEQVSIIYPLILGGKEVYDESGAPYGLYVNINVRENKVSGVNNLTSQLYDSSAYALETDVQKVLSYVTGSANDIYPGQNVQTKNIRLGTPTQVLMKYYSYSVNGAGQELYVPALRFPVTSQDMTPYYQTSILVPLVKEILDGRGNVGGGISPGMPSPEIMRVER